MTRILVFSKTTGYRHESIEAGVEAVRDLGNEHAFDVDATEDAAAFTSDNLRRYAALLFLSTSGDVVDDDQRAAFESYIRAGGGYVGVHGASTTEYGWPFYGEVVGARFDHHPKVQPATVLVEDGDHPATAHLDRTWPRVDEWYDFQSDPRERGVRVLLTVDESTYDGGRMGEGHPLAWCHDLPGGGRAFYTALGHTVESYAEPAFRAHLLGGITSVLR